jgi:hypothetical protein
MANKPCEKEGLKEMIKALVLLDWRHGRNYIAAFLGETGGRDIFLNAVSAVRE